MMYTKKCYRTLHKLVYYLEANPICLLINYDGLERRVMERAFELRDYPMMEKIGLTSSWIQSLIERFILDCDWKAIAKYHSMDMICQDKYIWNDLAFSITMRAITKGKTDVAMRYISGGIFGKDCDSVESFRLLHCKKSVISEYYSSAELLEDFEFCDLPDIHWIENNVVEIRTLHQFKRLLKIRDPKPEELRSLKNNHLTDILEYALDCGYKVDWVSPITPINRCESAVRVNRLHSEGKIDWNHPFPICKDWDFWMTVLKIAPLNWKWVARIPDLNIRLLFAAKWKINSNQLGIDPEDMISSRVAYLCASYLKHNKIKIPVINMANQPFLSNMFNN
jgi:hypothetical protein